MGTVAVDPRIRARRVSVARDAGRRRLRRVVIASALVGLALLGLGLTWTPLLDVEEISVAGSEHTSETAVREAAGVSPGDPLVWFDTGAAERALEALPWVASAVVGRTWSGSVDIEVVEREAVAVLATPAGDYRLADGTGRVLAAATALPADLTLVEGVRTSAAPGDELSGDVAEALAVAGAVPSGLRAEVATLVVGADGGVVASLRSGGELVVGDAEDADDKLAAAAAVLATVPPGCVERLDVTLPAAPALVRVDGC